MSTLSIIERQSFLSRIGLIRSIQVETNVASALRSQYDIRNVGKNGVIRLLGSTYLVSSFAYYREMNEKWTKNLSWKATELTLYCLRTGEVSYIEWSVDDSLEISFTQRKISNREVTSKLRYDDATVVNLDDIDDIVEEEETLVFDGKNYTYDDDYGVSFEADDGRKSYAYIVEFESSKGEFLTLEGWNENPKSDTGWEYEVYLSVPIDSRAIEVLSLGNLSV